MKTRILCFGDSNTWGAIPQEMSRYDSDTRWTGILQKELGDEYIILEEGYCGRTTVFDDPIENRLSGIKYFYPCVESQSPLDLIIIMLGTNDLKPRFGVDAGSIASALKNYVDALKIIPISGTQPKILLVSPILVDSSYRQNPISLSCFGENADKRSSELAFAYENFANTMQLHFINAADYAKASKLDGIHMDAKEHQKLGIAFAKKIKEIFE